MRRLSLRVVFLLGLAAAWHWRPWRDLRYGEGWAVAPADPIQCAASQESLGEVAGFELTRLAEYSITARVLSARRYRHEPDHDLVPIDLALGWGPMSDDAVLDRLGLSQSFRHYFCEWRGAPPIPAREMTIHSANTHIIPANEQVRDIIFSLRRGSVVKLDGELVKARNVEGREWLSSLTREDTGNGACEVMYVRMAKKVSPVNTSSAVASR